MRRTRWSLLFIALALAVPGSNVAARDEKPVARPMLPPDLWSDPDRQQFMERWFGNQLRAMRERPLWVPQPESRLIVDRLLILPSFRPAIAIRIERLPHGDATVTMSELDGAGGYAPGKLRDQTEDEVAAGDLRALEKLIREGNLWQLPTDKPLEPGGDICTDGVEYVFEHRGADGYRLIHRGTCDMDDALYAIAQAWRGVAGLGR